MRTLAAALAAVAAFAAIARAAPPPAPPARSAGLIEARARADASGEALQSRFEQMRCLHDLRQCRTGCGEPSRLAADRRGPQTAASTDAWSRLPVRQRRAAAAAPASCTLFTLRD